MKKFKSEIIFSSLDKLAEPYEMALVVLGFLLTASVPTLEKTFFAWLLSVHRSML